MYIPKHFKEIDQNRIIQLLQENAFGTLITTVDNVPLASHIPFLINNDGTTLSLCGHLAYANEQCKQLQENAAVMVIFQGPHTYISPSWYKNAGVPTWNYATVHLYGTAKLIQSNEALKKLINALAAEYEQSLPSPWQPKYSDKMLTAIVGFEIEITDIQAKYKLSQNRAVEGQLGVIEKLEGAGGEDAAQIAALMKENLQ